MNQLEHEQALQRLINNHLDEAESRVDLVYRTHFARPGSILSRHWRHRRDIPADLMALPRHAWGFAAGLLGRKKAMLPKCGKIRELETIIAEQLLDLPGLQQRIEAYVQPYQVQFEEQFNRILADVPALQRQEFEQTLARQLERLSTPIDGCREAVMFLIAGLIGKVFSKKVTFGSSVATGKAVAVSIYMSQLSWFGSLWAHLFGVPSWVGYAGAGAGVLTALLVAPLLSPFFELAINRLRARKILGQTVASARQKLTGKGHDAVDLAGKTAIYLQMLPDLIELGRRTAKALL